MKKKQYIKERITIPLPVLISTSGICHKEKLKLSLTNRRKRTKTDLTSKHYAVKKGEDIFY